MINTKIFEFYKRAVEEQKFDSSFFNTLKSISNENELRIFMEKELIPIAKSMGYEFNAEDLMSYEKDVAKRLSEKDLEFVSGGMEIKHLLLGGLTSLAILGGGAVLSNTSYAVGEKDTVSSQTNKSGKSQRDETKSQAQVKSFDDTDSDQEEQKTIDDDDPDYLSDGDGTDSDQEEEIKTIDDDDDTDESDYSSDEDDDDTDESDYSSDDDDDDTDESDYSSDDDDTDSDQEEQKTIDDDDTGSDQSEKGLDDAEEVISSKWSMNIQRYGKIARISFTKPVVEVSELIQFLNENTIKSLDLSENYFIEGYIDFLASASTLTSLDLSKCTFDENMLSCSDISMLLNKLSTLTTLDLSDTSLNLGKIPGSKLTTLRLSNCDRINFVKLFGDLAANSTLTTLDLSRNDIPCGSELTELLAKNKTLKSLDLSGTCISDTEGLAEGLKRNSTLEILKLGSANINSEGVRNIAEALKVNSTITTLDLSGNLISADGLAALEKALEVNSTITTLELRGNEIGISDKIKLCIIRNINKKVEVDELSDHELEYIRMSEFQSVFSMDIGRIVGDDYKSLKKRWMELNTLAGKLDAVKQLRESLDTTYYPTDLQREWWTFVEGVDEDALQAELKEESESYKQVEERSELKVSKFTYGNVGANWVYSPDTHVLIVKSVSSEENLFSRKDYVQFNFFDIREVVLGRSIKTIPSGSFVWYFHNLRSVEGEGIEIIEDHAFDSCCIERAFFPRVKSIGTQAFYNCSNLREVTMPLFAIYDDTTFKKCHDGMRFKFTDVTDKIMSITSRVRTPKLLIKCSQERTGGVPLDLKHTEVREVEQVSERIRGLRADSKNVSALALLGEYYLNQGQMKDAVDYLRKAMVKGSTRAMVLLGDCFYRGCPRVLSQNRMAAVQLYRIAAGFGDVDAMIRMGDSAGKSMSIGWYRQAKERGSASALLMFFNALYGDRISSEEANSVAKEYFAFLQSKEHEKGITTDTRVSAKRVGPKGTFSKKTEFVSIEEQRALYEVEYADTMFHLGRCYQFGFGMDRPDMSKAKDYYQKAAWKGNIDATNALGMCCYNEAFVVPKGRRTDSLIEAQKWWKRAAVRGDRNAAFNLAVVMDLLDNFSGTRTVKSEERIRDAYRKAERSSVYGAAKPFSPLDTVRQLTMTVRKKSNIVKDKNPEVTRHDISIEERNGLLILPPNGIVLDKQREDEYVNDSVDVPMKSLGKSLIFSSCISSSDVIQARIGDCYFLAALGMLADENPRAIMEAIRDNNDGTVTVRFYDDDGNPRYYRVNKSLPIVNSGLRDEDAKLWVGLFEKAYIFHRQLSVMSKRNDYKLLSGGRTYKAIQHITGLPIVAYLRGKNAEYAGYGRRIIDIKDPQVLIDFIKKYKDIYYFSCDFVSTVDDGMLSRHAYEILGFEEVETTHTGKQIFVILRNPHGTNVPTFERGADGRLVRKQANRAAGEHKQGIFKLRFSDFYDIFESVECSYKAPSV